MMNAASLFAFWKVEGAGLARLEFGQPILPESSPEEHVRWILEDYPQRRDELWVMGHSIAVSILRRWIAVASEDDPLLMPMIQAIGFLRSVSCSQHLARFLKHRSKQVRIAAITSIGMLSGLSEMALLPPFLADADPDIRRAAFFAACKTVDPAALSRLDRVAGKDQELRNRLQQARRRLAAVMAGSSRSFVAATIETEDYEDLLGLLQATWEQVLEFLGDRRRRAEVRRRALRLLSLPPMGKSRKQFLEIMLDRREPQDLRREAVRAVGRCRGFRAFDPLVKTLRSREPGFREAAAASLGYLGLRQAVDPLLDVWEESDRSCRESIRLAVRRLCDVDGADWLQERLERGGRSPLDGLHFIDANLRLAHSLGDDAGMEQMRSPMESARMEMALLLAQVGYPHHVRWLKVMAEKDESQANREIASRALRHLPAPEGRRRPGKRRPSA